MTDPTQPGVDRLRAALTDLYGAALPHASAPGVEAVHRTVRRRRHVRIGAAAAAIAAVIAAAAMTLPAPDGPPPVAPTVSPPAPPTLGPSATPSAVASSSPTTGAAAAPCDPNPRVTAQVSGGHTDGASLYFQLRSTRPGEPVCADAEVYVSWVSYYYAEDGRQLMYGGSGFTVPTMTRVWTPTIEVDMGCRGDLYVVARAEMGGQEIAAGVHHPFPIASASNGWAGEIASFISEPAVCSPEWPGGTSYPGPGAPDPPPSPSDSPSPPASP
jgi:hypothetical protein